MSKAQRLGTVSGLFWSVGPKSSDTYSSDTYRWSEAVS